MRIARHRPARIRTPPEGRSHPAPTRWLKVRLGKVPPAEHGHKEVANPVWGAGPGVDKGVEAWEDEHPAKEEFVTFRSHCPVCNQPHAGEGRTHPVGGFVLPPEPDRFTCSGCGAQLRWTVIYLSDWTGWEDTWPHLEVLSEPKGVDPARSSGEDPKQV